MSPLDYVAVVIAMGAGLLCIRHRGRIADMAVSQHQRLYGAKWDRRSFEYPFLVGGVLLMAWAVFVVIGGFLFTH